MRTPGPTDFPSPPGANGRIPGMPPRGKQPDGIPINLPPIAIVAMPATPEPGLGPVPTSVTVDRVSMNDGSLSVALRLATPIGAQIYFLQADTAVQIGGFLIQQGKAAKAGIVGSLGAPPPVDDDTGPVLTEKCVAELRTRDGEDWTTWPCVNEEPGHTAHAVDIPASHPLTGFRWGKPIEHDDYVATVPAATDP